MIMDFNKKEQKQTAGDNAIQTQVENQNNYNSTQINQYYGVSPTEVVSVATTVFNQMYALSAKNYAEIAVTTVNERINAFGCELFPRLERIEGALEQFKDPKFEFLLRDAQIAAAKTNRHEDLCLLSELLSCHVLKGRDKKIDTGISHAIKIVDEIDNDSLCALTIACAFGYFIPSSGIIKEGLNTLNEVFRKLLYLDLPKGMDWLDHLDMLGALRISSLNLKKSKDFLCTMYGGYACVGIKKGTQEFDKAYELLDNNKISHSVLVDNDCLNDYVRLAIVDINDVNPQYQECIRQIWNLYSKDKSLISEAQNKFINLWDSFDNLKVVRAWWDNIPKAYDVSYVGKVLAQTNAKRIDNSLPDLL